MDFEGFGSDFCCIFMLLNDNSHDFGGSFSKKVEMFVRLFPAFPFLFRTFRRFVVLLVSSLFLFHAVLASSVYFRGGGGGARAGRRKTLEATIVMISWLVGWLVE